MSEASGHTQVTLIRTVGVISIKCECSIQVTVDHSDRMLQQQQQREQKENKKQRQQQTSSRSSTASFSRLYCCILFVLLVPLQRSNRSAREKGSWQMAISLNSPSDGHFINYVRHAN